MTNAYSTSETLRLVIVREEGGGGGRWLRSPCPLLGCMYFFLPPPPRFDTNQKKKQQRCTRCCSPSPLCVRVGIRVAVAAARSLTWLYLSLARRREREWVGSVPSRTADAKQNARGFLVFSSLFFARPSFPMACHQPALSRSRSSSSLDGQRDKSNGDLGTGQKKRRKTLRSRSCVEGGGD